VSSAAEAAAYREQKRSWRTDTSRWQLLQRSVLERFLPRRSAEIEPPTALLLRTAACGCGPS